MSDAGVPPLESHVISPDAPDSNACNWAMLCHLAAFAGYSILPLFGWSLGPLLVWSLKRDEHPFIDEQGREALNFQLSMTIYKVVAVISCIGILVLPVILIADIVLIIIAAVKASSGEHYSYPFTINFVK